MANKRIRSGDKDTAKYLRDLAKQDGYQVEWAAGHLGIWYNGHRIWTASNSPSDWRSLANLKSQVRRETRMLQEQRAA